MSSDKGQKDKLDRLMQEGEQKGLEIFKQSSGEAQFGREVADLAGAGRNYLKYIIPERVNLDRQIEVWESVIQKEDDIIQSHQSISIQTASACGTASASAMIDFANPDTVSNFVEDDKQDEARVAAQGLYSVIYRQADKDYVLSLMQQYDLSRGRTGQKSPEELLQTAWSAFGIPVPQGATAPTSLLPMRECINATVEALRRRCPNQEKAKPKGKILSIGRQIADSTISCSVIESLQENYNN